MEIHISSHKPYFRTLGENVKDFAFSLVVSHVVYSMGLWVNNEAKDTFQRISGWEELVALTVWINCEKQTKCYFDLS